MSNPKWSYWQNTFTYKVSKRRSAHWLPWWSEVSIVEYDAYLKEKKEAADTKAAKAQERLETYKRREARD